MEMLETDGRGAILPIKNEHSDIQVRTQPWQLPHCGVRCWSTGSEWCCCLHQASQTEDKSYENAFRRKRRERRVVGACIHDI